MLFVVLSFESCLKPCWLETLSRGDYVLPPCQHPPSQIIPLQFWCQISWNPLKCSLRNQSVCTHTHTQKKTTNRFLWHTHGYNLISIVYSLLTSLDFSAVFPFQIKALPSLGLDLFVNSSVPPHSDHLHSASSFLFGREAASCSSVLPGLLRRPQ